VFEKQKQFTAAMQYVGAEFLDRVRYFHDVWWPARQLVRQAHSNRFQVQSTRSAYRFNHRQSGRIMRSFCLFICLFVCAYDNSKKLSTDGDEIFRIRYCRIYLASLRFVSGLYWMLSENLVSWSQHKKAPVCIFVWFKHEWILCCICCT